MKNLLSSLSLLFLGAFGGYYATLPIPKESQSSVDRPVVSATTLPRVHAASLGKPTASQPMLGDSLLDYTVWLRDGIRAAVNRDKDEGEAWLRIRSASKAIGAAVESRYGTDTRPRVTAFFDRHAYLVIEWTHAARARNLPRMNEITLDIEKNRDALAALLGAETGRDADLIRSILNDYMTSCISIARARIESRWTDETNAYRRIESVLPKLVYLLEPAIEE